mmetsp:Transcript_25523/g.52328  ORF Transcript_25523/g.52328 Transcript_25523/m.52328 type:complete len:241 (-) Transcript_25523:2128-2850(-)
MLRSPLQSMLPNPKSKLLCVPLFLAPSPWKNDRLEVPAEGLVFGSRKPWSDSISSELKVLPMADMGEGGALGDIEKGCTKLPAVVLEKLCGLPCSSCTSRVESSTWISSVASCASPMSTRSATSLLRMATATLSKLASASWMKWPYLDSNSFNPKYRAPSTKRFVMRSRAVATEISSRTSSHACCSRGKDFSVLSFSCPHPRAECSSLKRARSVRATKLTSTHAPSRRYNRGSTTKISIW